MRSRGRAVVAACMVLDPLPAIAAGLLHGLYSGSLPVNPFLRNAVNQCCGSWFKSHWIPIVRSNSTQLAAFLGASVHSRYLVGSYCGSSLNRLSCNRERLDSPQFAQCLKSRVPGRAGAVAKLGALCLSQIPNGPRIFHPTNVRVLPCFECLVPRSRVNLVR